MFDFIEQGYIQIITKKFIIDYQDASSIKISFIEDNDERAAHVKYELIGVNLFVNEKRHHC